MNFIYNLYLTFFSTLRRHRPDRLCTPFFWLVRRSIFSCRLDSLCCLRTTPPGTSCAVGAHKSTTTRSSSPSLYTTCIAGTAQSSTSPFPGPSTPPPSSARTASPESPTKSSPVSRGRLAGGSVRGREQLSLAILAFCWRGRLALTSNLGR